MANDKPAAPAPAPKSDLQLMAEAIGQAIRENREPGPFQRAGYSPERIAELTEPPKAKKWRRVACRSEDTQATFTACVVESKQFPAGRIVALENYTHPPGVAVYQSEGGLVPTSMQILRAGTAAPEEGRNPPKHDLTPYYMQWRWEEFWQKDLRRHAGKELKRQHAIDEAAFTTPWQDGRVGPLGN